MLNLNGFAVRFSYDSSKIEPSNIVTNEITDDEFDKEIDSNEDDYVVLNNEDADINDIKTALLLCPHLKDVKDVDDMADLFSFSNDSIRKNLPDK